MTTDAPPVVTKKKLIEVALPLDAINKASKREKSIRHGHPSTLAPVVVSEATSHGTSHHFCADGRRSVREPRPVPNRKGAQERERQRLFHIIEELVQWENITNEAVLERAGEEIWQSWRRACADNAGHPAREGVSSTGTCCRPSTTRSLAEARCP